MLGYYPLGRYSLGSLGQVVNNLQEASTQTIYAPRPLITVTAGATVTRYSTDDLVA